MASSLRHISRAALLAAVFIISSSASTQTTPMPASAPATPFAPKAPASATLKDAFKGVFYIGVAMNRNKSRRDLWV